MEKTNGFFLAFFIGKVNALLSVSWALYFVAVLIVLICYFVNG